MGFWNQQRTPLPKRISKPVEYPSWSAVSTESGVYLIKGKMKMKLFSDRAADSWSFNLLYATDKALTKYTKGPSLGFRNGTLLRDFSDNKLYLIVDNKRRHITSPDYLDRLGFDEENIYLVSHEEVKIHEEGEVLS